MLSFKKIWHSATDWVADLFFYASHSIILPLRYRVEIKGKEYLLPQEEDLKVASTLFLANHSSHLDATFIAFEFLKNRVPFIIWALDRTFKLPYLRWAARHVQVVKVPNITERRSEKHSTKLHKLVTRTADGLKKGQNFLIFPAGVVKKTPIEKIDGKSALPLILQQYPEVKIILVRITGLWGSRFSCAIRPELRWGTPWVPGTVMFLQTLKMLFLNALFFIPKRKIIVEFAPAPSDFPRNGTRLEICRYLEKYYNAPWGPLGEPLHRVPDYFWKNEYIEHAYQTQHYSYDLNQVSKPMRNAIVKLVADKADRDCMEIDFDMQLGADLGFDSLDIAEILTQVERQYDIKRLVPQDLTTVGHLIAIAAKIPIACEFKKGEFHQINELPSFKKPNINIE